MNILPLVLAAASSSPSFQVTDGIKGRADVGADTVSEISWMDSDGKVRTVQFVTESEKYNPGWLAQYRYDDPQVVCNAVDSGSGGLCDISHNGGGSKSKGKGEWGTENMKVRWLFKGAHHGTVRIEYDMGYSLGEKKRGPEPIHVTRDLSFRSGDSSILYAISLDFSAVPKNKASVDTRSPYLRWDFDGSEASVKSGEFGMGPYSGYRCGTNGTLACDDVQNPKGQVTKTLDDNTVPYNYEYNAKSSRMEGILGTRTYVELPQGSECWAQNPDPIIKAGTYERDKVNAWELPYQLGGYSGWIEKMTWQVPYDLGKETVVDGPYKYSAWPKYSYSTLVLLDKMGGKMPTDPKKERVPGRFGRMIREQERIPTWKATAKVGKILTAAPFGPGRESDEPETLKNPGYDPIQRAWRFICEESHADVKLELGGDSLENPTFIFDHYHGAQAPVIKDAFVSLDAEAMKLYVTLAKTCKGSASVKF